MRIIKTQSDKTRVEKLIGTAKRMAARGLNYMTNVFERNPISDVFISSTRFVKLDIPESDKKYVSQINSVPVLGAGEKEQPILRLVQESMFNMLKINNGTSEPYSEILFAHLENPHTIACIYGGKNVLCVNKTYLENIDSVIAENVRGYEVLEWITKNKDGQYKIQDILRNQKSEQFEKLLNEYSPEWSLKDKFLFDRMGTYYSNIANYVFRHPEIIIEKIFENENYCQILKDKGLFEKKKDILPYNCFRKAYLQEIGHYCHLPEDICLTTYPEIVFTHEYIHKWCFDNFSEDYIAELHSEPVITKWNEDKQTQLTAEKVSIRATEDPMEYIAEVGAGLAGGQKFDNDIMSLYESLKGPKL